jgi:hypothetical protein
MMLSIAAVLSGQEVFRSETHLVQVQVVVRDSKGPVTGLTKDDFQILDEGNRKQSARSA